MYRTEIDFPAFDDVYREIGSATHPLVRLVMRLPVSLVVAGNGLLPLRFAAVTCQAAPSNAFNCGFHDHSGRFPIRS